MTADNDNGVVGAIMASTVSVKTMADSTLRLTIDIEPNDAATAFQLFGMRGTPVALARMTKEAAVAEGRKAFAQPEPKPAPGGALCKLAAIWSGSDDFRLFLAHTLNRSPSDVADPAEIIRTTCGVTSRAELDHNDRAAQIFHNTFRLPYQEWQQGRRA